MGWAIGDAAARRGHGADPRDGRQRRAPVALPARPELPRPGRSRRHRRSGPRSRWSTHHRQHRVHDQRPPAADRADPPELQPPVDRLLGHRQRAAHRQHRDQLPADHAEQRWCTRRTRPAVHLRAVLHQRHRRAARPHRRRRLQHATTAGTTPSAPPSSSAPGPTTCTRRSRPGRSASANTAPAPASPSTPTTRPSPDPDGSPPPGGVADPGARIALEADEDPPLPVGEVHLEHVRLRRRQPQRGRHAAAATTRAWSPTIAQTSKDAFFWYKANWTTAPFVHITSRRFTPRTSATATVKVYANMDSVRLQVNGTSYAPSAGADRIFQWTNVALGTGANTITATGTSGATTATDTVTWMRN